MLERILAASSSGQNPDLSDVVPLDVEAALGYKRSGNVPDECGRTLRLVLHGRPGEDLTSKRLLYEPDMHEAPSWRREGSAPVNVVPFRVGEGEPAPRPWWEDPRMQRFEAEWRATGRVAGLTVPEEYRGFIFKTIAALEDASRAVNVDSVVSSTARWLLHDQVAELRAALEMANTREPGP